MRTYASVNRTLQPVRDSAPLLSFLYCTKTILQRYQQQQQQRHFAVSTQSYDELRPVSSQPRQDASASYSPPGLSGRSRFPYASQPAADASRRPPRYNPRPSNHHNDLNASRLAQYDDAKGIVQPSFTQQPRQHRANSHERDGRPPQFDRHHGQNLSNHQSGNNASQFGRKRSGRADRPTRQRLSEGRVPFDIEEHAAAERAFQDIKQESESPNSTLTASEYRGFQSLLALQQSLAKMSQSKESERKEENALAVNEVLERAIGIKVAPQDDIPSYGLSAVNSTPKSESAAAQKDGDLNRIKALMMDGKTDSLVWAILQKEVFARLRKISLPELQHSLAAQHEDEQMDDVTAASNEEQAGGEDPMATEDTKKNTRLMQSLPGHLMNFQSVLATHFPSSLHSLAILPYLQRQGDAVFALGASTELFNVHLRQLYLKHYDIASMVKVLQEMHDKVYDFDGETLQIVDTVLRDANEALDGQPQNARAMLWDGEQMRSLRRALRSWRDRIEEQIGERALHEARRREDQGLQQDVGLV